MIKTISYLGLGAIGSRMAANLRKHGYPLVAPARHGPGVWPETTTARSAQVRCFSFRDRRAHWPFLKQQGIEFYLSLE